MVVVWGSRTDRKWEWVTEDPTWYGLCVCQVMLASAAGTIGERHESNSNEVYISLGRQPLTAANFSTSPDYPWRELPQVVVVFWCFFCSNKSFVATNTWQNTSFVATKVSFVATKLCLSSQGFCRNKIVCRAKRFVATSILLSRQKTIFVATKMWQLPPMISDRLDNPQSVTITFWFISAIARSQMVPSSRIF